MQGVEIAHCNAVIKASERAYSALMNTNIDEALKPINNSYGKGDTLGLDAIPEINIMEALKQYDFNSIVITEEVGTSEILGLMNTKDPSFFKTIFISDPTDRSACLEDFLKNHIENPKEIIGNVLQTDQAKKKWEELYGGPVAITGAVSAISCIRRGIPILSVIVNYVTGQMFVSCAAGNYVVLIPKDLSNIDLSLDYVKEEGENVIFPKIKNHFDMKRFATFTGKSGYKENLIDSNLIEPLDIEKFIFHKNPGGPARVLYLSNFQPKTTPMGFILANGEKIGEWIHWIPFVRFARQKNDQSEQALSLFEVYQSRPWTKDGVLMSTPPAYSIFKPMKYFAPEKTSEMFVDVSMFANFTNPSKIRSTLLVMPVDNHWAKQAVSQHGYRSIIF